MAAAPAGLGLRRSCVWASSRRASAIGSKAMPSAERRRRSARPYKGASFPRACRTLPQPTPRRPRLQLAIAFAHPRLGRSGRRLRRIQRARQPLCPPVRLRERERMLLPVKVESTCEPRRVRLRALPLAVCAQRLLPQLARLLREHRSPLRRLALRRPRLRLQLRLSRRRRRAQPLARTRRRGGRRRDCLAVPRLSAVEFGAVSRHHRIDLLHVPRPVGLPRRLHAARPLRGRRGRALQRGAVLGSGSSRGLPFKLKRAAQRRSLQSGGADACEDLRGQLAQRRLGVTARAGQLSPHGEPEQTELAAQAIYPAGGLARSPPRVAGGALAAPARARGRSGRRPPLRAPLCALRCVRRAQPRNAGRALRLDGGGQRLQESSRKGLEERSRRAPRRWRAAPRAARAKPAAAPPPSAADSPRRRLPPPTPQPPTARPPSRARQRPTRRRRPPPSPPRHAAPPRAPR